jgi:hypothetical protein
MPYVQRKKGPTRMTTDQLRLAHTARPFRPFTIHTADGEPHLVPHPEFMLYVPGTRTCVVSDVNGLITIIDLLLVARLTFEPEPATR